MGGDNFRSRSTGQHFQQRSNRQKRARGRVNDRNVNATARNMTTDTGTSTREPQQHHLSERAALRASRHAAANQLIDATIYDISDLEQVMEQDVRHLTAHAISQQRLYEGKTCNEVISSFSSLSKQVPKSMPSRGGKYSQHRQRRSGGQRDYYAGAAPTRPHSRSNQNNSSRNDTSLAGESTSRSTMKAPNRDGKSKNFSQRSRQSNDLMFNTDVLRNLYGSFVRGGVLSDPAMQQATAIVEVTQTSIISSSSSSSIAVPQIDSNPVLSSVPTPMRNLNIASSPPSAPAANTCTPIPSVAINSEKADNVDAHLGGMKSSPSSMAESNKADRQSQRRALKWERRAERNRERKAKRQQAKQQRDIRCSARERREVEKLENEIHAMLHQHESHHDAAEQKLTDSDDTDVQPTSSPRKSSLSSRDRESMEHRANERRKSSEFVESMAALLAEEGDLDAEEEADIASAIAASLSDVNKHDLNRAIKDSILDMQDADDVKVSDTTRGGNIMYGLISSSDSDNDEDVGVDTDDGEEGDGEDAAFDRSGAPHQTTKATSFSHQHHPTSSPVPTTSEESPSFGSQQSSSSLDSALNDSSFSSNSDRSYSDNDVMDVTGTDNEQTDEELYNYANDDEDDVAVLYHTYNGAYVDLESATSSLPPHSIIPSVAFTSSSSSSAAPIIDIDFLNAFPVHPNSHVVNPRDREIFGVAEWSLAQPSKIRPIRGIDMSDSDDSDDDDQDGSSASDYTFSNEEDDMDTDEDDVDDDDDVINLVGDDDEVLAEEDEINIAYPSAGGKVAKQKRVRRNPKNTSKVTGFSSDDDDNIYDRELLHNNCQCPQSALFSINAVNDQIKQHFFNTASIQSNAARQSVAPLELLPIENRKHRQQVHGLAELYQLESYSAGEGSERFTTLKVTKHTSLPNAKLLQLFLHHQTVSNAKTHKVIAKQYGCVIHSNLPVKKIKKGMKDAAKGGGMNTGKLMSKLEKKMKKLKKKMGKNKHRTKQMGTRRGKRGGKGEDDNSIGALSSSRSAPSAPIPEDHLGHRMLRMLGWSAGFGLGVRNRGMTQPILPTLKFGTKGIGF